jgi:integrase
VRSANPPQQHAGGLTILPELAAFLYAAERISPAHTALAVLLGLNGLRVNEACAANLDDLGFEPGHRTLRIVGKGNQPALIPLVPRTARTIDLAIGKRISGPILTRSDGPETAPKTGGTEACPVPAGIMCDQSVLYRRESGTEGRAILRFVAGLADLYERQWSLDVISSTQASAAIILIS